MLSLWDRVKISIACYQGQRDFEREFARKQKQEKMQINSQTRVQDDTDMVNSMQSGKSTQIDSFYDYQRVLEEYYIQIGKQQLTETQIRGFLHDNLLDRTWGITVEDVQEDLKDIYAKYNPVAESVEPKQDVQHIEQEQSPFERWCETELVNRLEKRNGAGETETIDTDYEEYDCFGYDRQGTDRSGKKREDYRNDYMRLCKVLGEAKNRLYNLEYRDALHRAGLILGTALDMLLVHTGEYKTRLTNDEKLEICRESDPLKDNPELLGKLYEMKRIRNRNEHEIGYGESVDHDTAHFMVMTAKDLVKVVQETLGLYFV